MILDLCGGTGSWSKPYRDRGYETVVLTLPQDIRLLEPTIWRNVFMILCAPPCDHFAVSGARWWKDKGSKKLLEGLSVVDACFRFIALCQPEYWCLENPVGRLKHYIGKPKFIFNPCDFGDPYTKKTLLWGKFNIPVKNPVPPTEGSKLHRLPPSKNRKELRSKTPEGFAEAFYQANNTGATK